MEQIRASQEAMGCGAGELDEARGPSKDDTCTDGTCDVADSVKLPGNKTMGSGGTMMDHNQPKVEVKPEPGFVVKTTLETGGSEEDQVWDRAGRVA